MPAVLKGGTSKRIGKSLGLKTKVYETFFLVLFLWKIIESLGLSLNMILNQVSSSPDVIF